MKTEQELKEQFFIKLQQFLIYENRKPNDCPELVTKEGLWKLAKEIGGQAETPSYASPASSGVQNGEKWQKCPKCDGQGIVSKPSWIAGDQNAWVDTQTSHTCNLCNGMMVIKQ